MHQNRCQRLNGGQHRRLRTARGLWQGVGKPFDASFRIVDQSDRGFRAVGPENPLRFIEAFVEGLDLTGKLGICARSSRKRLAVLITRHLTC